MTLVTWEHCRARSVTMKSTKWVDSESKDESTQNTRPIKTFYILIYKECALKVEIMCNNFAHLLAQSHPAERRRRRWKKHRLSCAFITSFQFVYCYSIASFCAVLFSVAYTRAQTNIHSHRHCFLLAFLLFIHQL